MLELGNIEEALRDTIDGIDKCQTLLDFIRKRQELEEEYSRALSTHYYLPV